jgi:hypothetical protein
VGVGQGECAVAQSVVVDFETGEAIRITPQIGGDEVERVLKVAALDLKMMRAQIHAFRPDRFVQQLHGLSLPAAAGLTTPSADWENLREHGRQNYAHGSLIPRRLPTGSD